MKTRLFLTLFLILTVLVAGLTFLRFGTGIIGANYYESEEIIAERDIFMENLIRYEIDTIDFEAVKETVTVEQDEINYYRDYYGSLTTQIDNVRSQYADLLENEDVSETNRKAYEDEMNRKIEEIRKNFESDDVVKEKILQFKTAALEKYQKDYEAAQKSFTKNRQYFGYDLTDENGRTYKALKDEKVVNRLSYKVGTWDITGNQTIDLGAYLSGQPGLENSITIELEPKDFSLTGEINTYKSIVKKPGINENKNIFFMRQVMAYILWGLGIVAIILLATVLKPTREVFSWPVVEEVFYKWPIDTRIVITVFSGIFTLSTLENMSYKVNTIAQRYVYGDRGLMMWGEELFTVVMCYSLLSIFILSAIWLVQSVKEEGISEDNSLFVRLGLAVKESFINKTIGKQTLAMFIVFFFGGMGFAGVLVTPVLLLIYVPLFMFILLPIAVIYFKRMGYLNKVMQQTEKMAAGELTTAVEVKGKSPIAKHAASLNDVRKGIEVSVKEQAKSERLKTELITNVSHDLRTPLTSIITYTDLLKNEDISAEERTKYVDILDKKSQRLKTLIEDLFEVSKMASGNIELMKQRVDLAQMLQQAAAEHNEDFKNYGLDLRVIMEEQPILAYVDGQKWWRVIDNLLLNACKYSLAGTRVYVSLKEVNGVAELSIKNIAKYELSENVQELTERFKRADTSRHTEGSGLGLAIAQSIVDLHGGQLSLDVDGDLFKVTVKVNTI